MADANCSTENHQQIRSTAGLDYFDADRQDIALSASIEIEGIAIFVARELDAIQEQEPEIIAIKNLVLRIKELNSVIMGAVGDEFDKVASLRHRLNGRIASKKGADHA